MSVCRADVIRPDSCGVTRQQTFIRTGSDTLSTPVLSLQS